ncbi:MAG: glycosyltransferase family 39 protein [Candidatus Krumholzibacteria bacterium]|jgi:4-amino-4-deoxy-L-arabinose transferase-like glycosyltransferase|nr:glycosyltransferase family 39 protein [Candidatus Krumholzibacteria bacterium]MDP6669240.1 glycosyltransferase family 39 protein [Candidatus Krumholzibacteria bacterium]MDP6798031.1 glycosyltransferase family 39 protein [Candidatus Krumholzibacteria bacterium]MDP7021944.1 glycosyltransferase family 39 protein [Candidatus Krumholzibacteria bacterium]
MKRWRWDQWLGVMTLLAFLLRLIWILTLESRIFWYDGQEYLRLAHSILSGAGYRDANGDPTAYWPPGYPFFVAVSGAKILGVRLMQALLGALTVPLAFLAARRIFGTRPALLAAFFVTIYPLYIYAAGSFYAISLQTLLMLSVFALCHRALEKDRQSSALLAGIFGAWAALTSASALPALLLAAAWLKTERWRRGSLRRGFRLALVFILPILLSVGAWTLRNHHHFGRPVPVSLNGGYNFWLGNSPGVKATTGNRWTEEMQEEFAEISLANPGEAALDAALYERGKEYVAKDPAGFVKLSLSKAVNLWRLWPAPMTEDRPGLDLEKVISVLSYGLLLPFGLFGVFRALRSSSAARLALLFFLSYTALHAFFIAKFRFRLPLDAILFLYAAGVLADLASRLGWDFWKEEPRA